MAARNTIAASIVTNVVFAIAVVVLLARQRLSPVSNEPVSVVINKVTNVTVAVIQETEVAATNTPPFAGFKWSRLESEEYPAYVANLRDLGCPEKTIRDIILPDIERLYSKRRAEVSAARDFWMSGLERVAADRERKQKLMALVTEEADLIKGLLGVDWLNSRDSRTGDQRFEYMIAYLLTTTLSPAQAKQMITQVKKYEAQRQLLLQEARGVLAPEDRAKSRELVKNFRNEMSKLMPPQEFEEFNLKAAAIEQHQLAERSSQVGLSLSPDEFREIVRLRAAGSDIFNGLFQTDLEEKDENALAKFQREREAETKIQALLGESRYAKFQEATDNSLRSALQFVKAHELPASLGHALYEVQQAAEEQALSIKYDESLSPSQRRHALQAVRSQTESVLTETLGEEFLKTYRDRNGRWLKKLGLN